MRKQVLFSLFAIIELLLDSRNREEKYNVYLLGRQKNKTKRGEANNRLFSHLSG